MGSKKADSLIGWYAFTGSCNTGSFAGKGVASQVKAFLQADDAILNAFSEFGATALPPHEILSQMERYVCLLYKTSDINSTDIIEVRWKLFAQKERGTTTASYYRSLRNTDSSHISSILYGISVEVVITVMSKTTTTY